MVYKEHVFPPKFNASTGKWTLTYRTSNGYIRIDEHYSEEDVQLTYELALIESAWYNSLRHSSLKSPPINSPFIISAARVYDSFGKAVLNDPKLVPALALHYFAGMSIQEILQINPQHISIKNQYMLIPNKKTGSNTRVVTELPTTLWQWIAPWQHPNGKLIIDKKNLRIRVDRIHNAAFGKMSIAPNGRLSFAIFGYTISGSIDTVSTWLGIPPQFLLILNKFDRSRLKSKAGSYFGVTPPDGYSDIVISLNDEH